MTPKPLFFYLNLYYNLFNCYILDLRPMLLLDDNALEEFADIDVSNPNAVVIGLAPQKLHYEKLNEAFR